MVHLIHIMHKILIVMAYILNKVEINKSMLKIINLLQWQILLEKRILKLK